MPYGDPTKGLRFANLIRVSTERQEKKGESLRTQTKHNGRDLERLGAGRVEVYGGQEHATEGWERAEFDRLLADARKGKLDAMIVNCPDRWSRENARSKEGLQVFRDHGVRFFISTMEMNLFDPTHCFIIGMNAEVAEFIALLQTKKSMDSKIERAKRGLPSCGRLPYGRTYDKDRELWGVDEEKKAKIVEVATRYLKGESLTDLTAVVGLHFSTLLDTLKYTSGDTWVQTFSCKRLNYEEKIPTPVPRLLDDEVINAILARIKDKTKVRRHPIKHQFLLGRKVLCMHCGAPMVQQFNRQRRPRYRHVIDRRIERTCPDPGASVWAEDLEEAVLHDLFALFGNPLAIERAVQAASPNMEEVEELRKRQDRLTRDLKSVKSEKERLVDFMVRGVIVEDEGVKKMQALRERGDKLQKEVEAVNAQLDAMITPEQVREVARTISARFVDPDDPLYFDMGKWADEREREEEQGRINRDLAGMSFGDRRGLIELVFDGTDPSGRKRGVYVARVPGRERCWRQQYRYEIVGRLVAREGVTSRRDGGEFFADPDHHPMLQHEIRAAKKAVGGSGLY
jgi:site-specific DNA recombinase